MGKRKDKRMNEYILIKGQANWADEIDIDYVNIWVKEEWKRHLKDAKKYFDKHKDDVEVYVGTNESVRYCGFEDYKNTFKTTDLTDDEAKFLREKVITSAFGIGNDITISEFDDDEY
jgi:hypothetical protein